MGVPIGRLASAEVLRTMAIQQASGGAWLLPEAAAQPRSAVPASRPAVLNPSALLVRALVLPYLALAGTTVFLLRLLP